MKWGMCCQVMLCFSRIRIFAIGLKDNELSLISNRKQLWTYLILSTIKLSIKSWFKEGLTNTGSWNFFQIHKWMWLATVQALSKPDVEHLKFLAKRCASQKSRASFEKRNDRSARSLIASLLNYHRTQSRPQLLATRWKPRPNLLALLGRSQYHSAQQFWKICHRTQWWFYRWNKYVYCFSRIPEST